MSMFRRKPKIHPPVRAMQIASLDVTTWPDWAQNAQKSGEIYCHLGDALAYDFVPVEYPQVIGLWVVEDDTFDLDFDCTVLTEAKLREIYEVSSHDGI